MKKENTESGKVSKSDYEYYMDNYNELGRVHDVSNENVDKKHYATATGALAISVAILPFLGDSIKLKCILISGLCSIVLSILLNLFAHMFSEYKARKGMEEINKLTNTKKYNHEELAEIINNANKIPGLLNYSMVFFLLLGIIFLLWFIVYNL